MTAHERDVLKARAKVTEAMIALLAASKRFDFKTQADAESVEYAFDKLCDSLKALTGDLSCP